MNSGNYKKRVKIYEITEHEDGFGGFFVQNVFKVDVWANINTINNSISKDFGLTEVENSILVNIRKRKDFQVSKSMLIEYRNKKYSIISIKEPEFNNIDISLICKYNG